MINKGASSVILAFTVVLLVVAHSQASPMAGDKITLGYGSYHSGVGGEFLMESTTLGSDYSFVTFCLEKNEYFNPGSTYIVESLEDYAKNGGYGRDVNSPAGMDYISNTTKWLMNEYVLNYNSIYDGRDKNSFAGLMQNTVWFLENEIKSLNDSYLLTYYQQQMGAIDTTYSMDYLPGIKVVNIFDGQGVYKQSQLIANPVPEPATMLLFGSGLVGLAAIGRRKIKK